MTHRETGYAAWVWGETPERRVEEAQRVIDDLYELRANEMAELIEAEDKHGPNCWLIGSDGGYTSAT